MEISHDFMADNLFFIENYSMLLRLHCGKHVVIAGDSIVFVAETAIEALSWSDKFCMKGRCSILEVSPTTYQMIKEGVWV